VIESAVESVGTNVYAQRIVINKIIDEHKNGKKPNESVVQFKEITKSHPSIIPFWLFFAEFYRKLNNCDLVSHLMTN